MDWPRFGGASRLFLTRVAVALGCLAECACVTRPSASRAPSAPALSMPVQSTPTRDAASSEPLATIQATEATTSAHDATPTLRDDATPTPSIAPATKTYRSVLSVGDSFNGAFSLALEKKFKAEGAAFSRDVWVAVALSTFAREPRFAKLLDKHAPDLVIVNLGANDIDDHEPEAQAKYIRQVVALIRARACDCYWVAPALWKKDSGIVDVLAKSVGPCRFFDSRGFKVERRGDGWHPSVDGGALWAEKFWTFFKRESDAP